MIFVYSVANNPLKILIVGPAWIGDMVLAQSLFKVLRQRHPQSRLDVLAPVWTHPLLSRMPEVDEAIAAPFAHGKFDLGARLKLGRALRARGYDRTIVLPNSWKSALVPWAARIPRRTGFTGELRYGLLNDTRRLDKKKWPRTVDRFVALGLDAGATLPEIPNPQLNTNTANAHAVLGALEPRAAQGSRARACARAPNTVQPNAGRRNISPRSRTPSLRKLGRYGSWARTKTPPSPPRSRA